MAYTKRYSKTDRREYYEQFVISAHMIQLLNVNDSRPNEIAIDTSVRFNGLNFGEKPKEVIVKMGTPDFIFKNLLFSPLIYLYRETILSKRVITQFHFIDDKLLYSCRTFNGYEEGLRLTVKKALIEKYIPGYTDTNVNDILKDRVICLQDQSRNRIYLVDYVLLYIIYTSAELEVSKMVSDHESKQKQNEEVVENNNQKVLSELL